MSNPLWDYSLATYRQPGVAATCLALQDAFDVDVNLLLFAAWLAHMNRCLCDGHLTELDTWVTDWRNKVVKPLRELRRQLHGYTEAAGMYGELKSLELRAEQAQQDMMYAFHQRSAELVQADYPLLGNLRQVALLACPDARGWEATIGHLASLIPR